jgi:predicted YcjX-like family ATPase
MIGPRPDGAVVIWFLNDHPMGSRDFSDWSSALRWSEQMQAQNWAVGWRLISD